MGAGLLGLLLILGGWTGCGRKAEAPIAATETPATQAVAAAESTTAPANAAPVASSDDAAQMAAVLGELTQAVRKYAVEKRQVPRSFDELVTQGYLSRTPQAPAGKAFVITKELQVQLK
jgi:hypothetical protein